MQLTDDRRAGAGWIREAWAGCTGALTVAPVFLTIGLLAFSPLGAHAAAATLSALLITAGMGALVHAAISRSRLPVAGLSSATALTLAGLVSRLAADPHLAPLTAAGVKGIVALCGLSLLLCGIVQIGLALLGLARLSRIVPQPVLAGFMNSAALLALLAQLPLLLDLPQGARPTLGHWGAAWPAALLLGLGTALVIWLAARRWRRLPAALLGLAAGTLAHALWSAWAGPGAAGALIGPLPSAWPWPPAALAMLEPTFRALLQAHAGAVVATGLALAAIGTLESSLTLRAVDQLLDTRHDPRRELLAVGTGNVVCGLLGGVPLSAMRTRAIAAMKAGGRGRLGAWVGPVTLGLLFVLGSPLLARLPLPVLAGVMLTAAIGLADGWSLRLLARWWDGDHSRDLGLGIATVALVVATTAWHGMAAGVGLGVLLALIGFALRMNRSPVRERYLASDRPSRRIYPVAVEERLRALREGITVFELEGALFFGSSERLLDEVDSLGAECRCLVVDMRRVGAIDETGAVALQQMSTRLAARGIRVDLSGMLHTSTAAQALHSFAPGLPQWPDADRAIEAAEQRLLAEGDEEGEDVRAMPEVPLAESSLLAGLDAREVAFVATQLQSRQLAPGDLLFAEGDPGDCLYVLSQGSVSVLSAPDVHGRTQRYLSASPGMMIGETAMLDGGGRTASAVADAPTVVHALTLEALDGIGRAQPAVAIRLHRNVALHLSQRLRSAAGAWRDSAR